MELRGFGYKIAWFAIRGGEPAKVAAALELDVLGPCEWARGINAAYERDTGNIFITPEVNGWTLCVGSPFFDLLDGAAFPEVTARLARELGAEGQFFATYRVSEAHAWARAKPDAFERAYYYIGQDGVTVLDVGDQSAEERELGFRFFDERSPEASQDGYWDRTDLRWPNEQDVVRLAGLWSIDPRLGEGDVETTVGLLCHKPRPQPKLTPVRKPWWKLW